MSEIKLKLGLIISNKKLCEVFKCGNSGGMRRSKSTNTLVLISDKTKPYYKDMWKGDIFNYTGMGLTGDQSLSFQQNKTLAESNTNGVNVHLFEVYSKNQYMYQGQVKLAGEPYQEMQIDYKGYNRKVWIFPLIVVAGEVTPIPEDVFLRNVEEKVKHVRKVSTEELLNKLKTSMVVENRKVLSNQHIRDPIVSELAKRRAKGKCQLCDQDAPFLDKNKEPYLEIHHIEWLAHGGSDTLENTVALCPNCHRKMHILNKENDVKTLILKNKMLNLY